ncbi:MAG: hypothetical protein WA869_17935 [Alloacidobacterium sp.]|jgi:hypothetical protein
MDLKIAQHQLTNLMLKHGRYGAQDSEGWQAVREVEAAAEEGKPFPFENRRNPFQLYESVPGWEQVSAVLVAAAGTYWKALVSEKLEIIIA